LLSLDKDAETLCDFGLTPNQAKVYLSIVQLGMASVGNVSKASKVRREDVYRILPKLERMGLIEKILGKPTKIRAIPVEEALDILVKREREIASKKVSALMAKKDAFLKSFKPNLEKPKFKEEETQFALLSERDAVICKAISIMKNAEKEIALVTSVEEFFNFLPTFAETFKSLTRKHVRVRAILEVREHEDTLLRSVKDHIPSGVSIDTKYAYQALHHYNLVDNRQVLIATSPDPPLGKHPYLWTDNKGLVALMQENFERLWHTSMNSKAVQINAVPEKVIQFVKQMSPTDHIIFVYQSPEAKYNVLFNYLKFGLENGEAGAYVASEENPNEIRDAMKRFGINTEKYEETGALRILGCNDVYIIEGKFDIPNTIGMWNKLYQEALAKGFKGLRVTGEMACFFKRNLIPELVEYERALHRVLDLPIIAICAYNADHLTKAYNPIDLYNELVRAHGTVLFAGIDNKLGKIEIRRA